MNIKGTTPSLSPWLLVLCVLTWGNTAPTFFFFCFRIYMISLAWQSNFIQLTLELRLH